MFYLTRILTGGELDMPQLVVVSSDMKFSALSLTFVAPCLLLGWQSVGGKI